MSRAAGTLITTNQATYYPPRFMPGYRGYCPTIKYDYGETYGDATSKYFQDYRSEVMRTSKSNYSNGGDFPTYYTQNPDLVISNRARNHDRWLLAPKYELSNIDHDRTEHLNHFYALGMKHREYYKDKTGTLHPIEHFQLPVPVEEQFRSKDAIIITTTRSPEDSITSPRPNSKVHSQPPSQGASLRPSVREREMRDMHFEKR